MFDLYNEAVRHCKDKSEMLGNIYAARSGIFFNVGNRQKCLEEIDRALKCEVLNPLQLFEDPCSIDRCCPETSMNQTRDTVLF